MNRHVSRTQPHSRAAGGSWRVFNFDTDNGGFWPVHFSCGGADERGFSSLFLFILTGRYEMCFRDENYIFYNWLCLLSVFRGFSFEKKKQDPKIIFIFCPANVYRYTRSWRSYRWKNLNETLWNRYTVSDENKFLHRARTNGVYNNSFWPKSYIYRLSRTKIRIFRIEHVPNREEKREGRCSYY